MPFPLPTKTLAIPGGLELPTYGFGLTIEIRLDFVFKG